MNTEIKRDPAFEAIVTMVIGFQSLLDLYALTGDKAALDAIHKGITAALNAAKEM